jgi:ribosomal protein S18 acetylase RimI-like enzyme
MDVLIRRAMHADAERIARYNAAMARETEHLELDPERLLRGVEAVLADAARGFYLVAEAEGGVAGQMMITYEWSDWRNGVFWWIQSVYVEPSQRRRGIFRRLYQYALEQARAAGGVCGLRLYVEAGNEVARRTYEDLGMNRTVYEMFEVDFVIRREGGGPP